MKRIACTYHMTDRSAVFECQGVTQYNQDGLLMALYGPMTVEGRQAGFQDIRQALQADPDLKTQTFGGMYLLLVFDQRSGSLRLFQDFLNAPLAAYYVQVEDRLYLDTSLKHLLARTGLRPGLCRAAAAQFLRYGAVYGPDTLLEGVHKLAALNALAADGLEVRQYPVTYDGGCVGLEQAKSRWEDSLQASILACAQGQSALHMPLSAGYDSNYILYTLNQHTQGTIEAYTLGARHGASEVEVVKQNAACYPRVRLNIGYTDQDTLNHMEDLVWRLEGAVFETGIFLQYELARSIASRGGTRALCGECADQLMNQDFRIQPQQVPDPSCAQVTEDPYAYGAGIVVKKSGIMLNSFGVEGCYPYIDLGLAGLCRALAPLNKRGKLYHKALCQKRFPAPVLRHIAKVGGSTPLHSLFEDQAHIDAFLEMVRTSGAWAQFSALLPREQQARQGGLWGKLRRFVGCEPNLRLVWAKVLSKLRVTQADQYRAQYRRQERQLNQAMRVWYLAVFQRLFVEDFCPQRIGQTLPPRPQVPAAQAGEDWTPMEKCG